jgi:hypothetical protein
MIGQSALPTESQGDPPIPVDESARPIPKEFGGRDGPEPTRFGDWEKNGRCVDF